MICKMEELDREYEGIKMQTGNLEQIRDLKTKEIPDSALSNYEKLKQAKKGIALARIENDEYCGGCHLHLPVTIINQVLQRTQLVTCNNCNRILYFKKEKG